MRPDVAVIAPYPPAGTHHGGSSGVASYTANLTRGLAADGLDVTVVAPRLDGDPPEFRDGAVGVRRAFPLGRRALPAAIRAAAELRPRLVHLQWELFLYGGPSSLVGLLPALAATRRVDDAPLVTTMHQVVDPASVDRAYTALHRVSAPALVARAGIAGVQTAITRASDATIVHEEAFRRVLRAATVIPHGVELPGPADRATARARLGLGDELTAMCFGFLAPYKGFEIALEAAALAGPAVHLVVAGGEHPRLAGRAAGGYGEALRREHPHATFTGYVPDGDVARWFAAADIVLLPYPRPFSASGVLALALAHGTPVLMSPALARCAGAPSVLTAPLHPVALGAALQRLAADPAALAELRRWTRVLARGRRWSAVARRTAELYEEVLDGPRRPGRSVRAA